jgi:hypothetical protein
MVQIAMRAPSGDNLQPWIIIPDKTYSKFILDSKPKTNDFFDVCMTATQISCGAFLETFKIAALEFGYELDIKFDLDIKSTKIADLKFVKCSSVSIKNNKYNSELFNTIYNRVINKSFYDRHAYISEQVISEIEDVFKEYSIFKFIHFSDLKDGMAKEKISEYCYRADLVRSEIRLAHESFMSSVRGSESTEEELRTGIDYRSLEFGKFSKYLLKIVKSWSVMKYFVKFGFNKKIISDSTLKPLQSTNDLFFMYMNSKSKENFVRSGMVVQRIWLILSKSGFSVQPFASMTFLMRKLNYLNGSEYNESQKNELIDIIEKMKKIVSEKSGEKV